MDRNVPTRRCDGRAERVRHMRVHPSAIEKTSGAVIGTLIGAAVYIVLAYTIVTGVT